MLNRLRNRLILSHILPLLIVLPLLGVALVYLLESQVLIPSLSADLVTNAQLYSVILHDYPQVWNDPTQAQQILNQYSADIKARVMILEPDGTLLASSDPADESKINQILQINGFTDALAGKEVTRINYSQGLDGEIIDVLLPVFGSGQQVVGVLRFSHRFTSVSDALLKFRYWIGLILLFGLLGGAVIGLLLALSINHPIHQVTEAVYHLAQGEIKEPLPVQGTIEQKFLIEAVNNLVERLHKLEETRRILIGNLVHELGRPLGGLSAAIQVLLQGAKDDPKVLDELLTGINGEMNRLQRLLNDLAQVNDRLAGTFELHREEITLSPWLHEVCFTWKEAAQEKGVHWEAHFPESLPAIQADPLRLSQALGNLLSNAIKFTPSGGSVTIDGGESGDKVWIQVCDTGPGIPIEDQEKIFTPFYRSKLTRDSAAGMGLGLSIVSELVTAHGGTIEFHSQVGAGSKFTIWLPRQVHDMPPQE